MPLAVETAVSNRTSRRLAVGAAKTPVCHGVLRLRKLKAADEDDDCISYAVVEQGVPYSGSRVEFMRPDDKNPLDERFARLLLIVFRHHITLIDFSALCTSKPSMWTRSARRGVLKSIWVLHNSRVVLARRGASTGEAQLLHNLISVRQSGLCRSQPNAQLRLCTTTANGAPPLKLSPSFLLGALMPSHSISGAFQIRVGNSML